MKAVVPLADFQPVVAELAKLNKRYSIPVLSGIHLEVVGGGLTAYRTDWDVFVRRIFPDAGWAMGVAVVPAKMLADTLKSLTPTSKPKARTALVTLAMSGSTVEVSVDHGPIVRLPTFAEQDYPKWPTASDWKRLAYLTSTDWQEIVRGVLPATSADKTIPMLNHVNLAWDASGVLWANATDRYMAARMGFDPSPLHGQVNLPVDGVRLVAKLAGNENITVDVGGTDAAMVYTDHVGVWMRTYDDFPKLAQLFPDTAGMSTGAIRRKDLLETMLAVAKLSGPKGRRCRIAFVDGDLDVTAISQDGDDLTTFHVAAMVGGLSGSMRMNPFQLIDMLKAFPDDYITWHMTATDRPQLFTAGNLRWLVMPVRG